MILAQAGRPGQAAGDGRCRPAARQQPAACGKAAGNPGYGACSGRLPPDWAGRPAPRIDTLPTRLPPYPRRMNPFTLIGVAAGALMLGAAVLLSPADPRVYLNLPGLAIVLGGTLAATCLGHSLHEVRRVPRLLRSALRGKPVRDRRGFDELAEISLLWSRGDLRKVEEALGKVRNDFLRAGVRLLIDRVPEEHVVDVLQWRIARARAQGRAESRLLRTMAGFAPAFGMLGTLVGMINLLTVLGQADMDEIGRQMAVGLMTTFYGLLLANLVFKPAAVGVERRTEDRLAVMDMLLQGIAMMCERRSPALVRTTLQSFLSAGDGAPEDAAAARPSPPAAGSRAAGAGAGRA